MGKTEGEEPNRCGFSQKDSSTRGRDRRLVVALKPVAQPGMSYEMGLFDQWCDEFDNHSSEALAFLGRGAQ